MGCSSSIHAVPPTAAAQANQQGATKPQPVTPDSRVLRGQAYFAAGKVAEALKEFNATITTWPTYARAYLERGNVRLDQKDYSLAVGDYTMALQLQANLIQAYMMRCHARMALRQYGDALQDVREAERLDPENAQVKALKAQVRKAQAAANTNGIGSVSTGGGGTGSGEEEDAFAGLDTPKSTPSPSVRKLCMVCMDSERECRLRPCMHAALCVSCAEGLMARGYGCPICSSKIELVERGSFMRTFTVEESQGIVASARVVAPLASPGKSPLGRRFVPGSGAPVQHSLDNIIEGEEEGHTAVDAAMEAAAADHLAAAIADGALAPQRQRLSSGSGGGSGNGRPSTPPVVLDPHPLAGRVAAAAVVVVRRSSSGVDGGGGDVAEELPAALAGAAAAEEEEPRLPLPGEVVSYNDGAEAAEVAATAAEGQRAGSSGGGTGGAGAASMWAEAVEVEDGAGQRRRSGSGGGADGGVEADGGVDSPPAALTAVASAFLANSLADWIDEHSGAGDSPVRSAATAAPSASASRAQLPTVDEAAADAAAAEGETEAAAAVEEEGLVEAPVSRQSFAGFAASTAGSSASAADAAIAAAAAAAAAEIEAEGDGDGGDEAGAGTPAGADAPADDAPADGEPGDAAAAATSGGPVAEARCSLPASAAAGAAAGLDRLAGRMSFHGSGSAAGMQQQHPCHVHLQHHHQRPPPWSARSLVARAAAEGAAAGDGGAAVAAAGAGATAALRTALGGAYASCGAAAAAARPFSRERSASGRHGRVATALPPPLQSACSRLGARSGSRREGRSSRVASFKASGGGGGGGDGGASDPWVTEGGCGSGGGVSTAAAPTCETVLLPGAVPA